MSTFEVSVTPSDLKRTQEVSHVRAKSSGQRGQGVLFALPDQIKCAKSLNSFKNQLKKYILCRPLSECYLYCLF